MRRWWATGVAALVMFSGCLSSTTAPASPTSPTGADPTIMPTSMPPVPDTQTGASPAPTAEPTPSSPADLATTLLERMSLEQKVGQVFMLGFDGTAIDAGNRALVHDLHLGGVTLFARNVESPAQVRDLVAGLQQAADRVPLFVSIDQEGGLVARVTDGATVFPGNMALGATGDPELAGRVASATANELRAMGVNMNLAPVVDVNTNPLNPVIGVRSFGSTPDLVNRFGAAMIRGMQSEGVSAVAKHFPGHGDTQVDSHFDLPVVPHERERLDRGEFPPFQAAIDAGVDGVMTAHVYLPAIESKPDTPATLSRAVLTGLLRHQLGYQGLILTDALDMGAIKRDRTAAEAGVQAFEAGADMLLIAGITADDRAHLRAGPSAMLDAVRSGRITEQRLDESVRRILEVKARRGLLDGRPLGSEAPSLDVVGSPAHRALAQEAADRAVTLVRDERHLLPLHRGQRVLVVVPDDPIQSPVVEENGQRATLAERVARLAGPIEEMRVSTAPGQQDNGHVTNRARSADVIVLATYDLIRQPAQAALVRALAATGKPVIGIALRGPYDAQAVPEIGTFLAVYGDRPVHLQAAARALAGAIAPTGRVP